MRGGAAQAHILGLACERRTRWRRCVHNAGHLAHDTPLSAFAIEVVCDVGGAAPRRDLTTPNRDLTAPNRSLTAIKWGELRYTGTRA